MPGYESAGNLAAMTGVSAAMTGVSAVTNFVYKKVIGPSELEPTKEL